MLSFEVLCRDPNTVRATYDVLRGQLDEHRDLPSALDELHRICNPEEADWIDLEGRLVWSHGEATLAFGQHAGCSLRDLSANDPSYLAWLLNSDFESDVKSLVQRALPQTREMPSSY